MDRRTFLAGLAALAAPVDAAAQQAAQPVIGSDGASYEYPKSRQAFTKD